MRYVRSSQVVKREVAGEVFLIPIRNRLADMKNVFVLHGAGDFIWDSIDGKRGVEELTDLMTEEFDVSSSDARVDLDELIGNLKREGLVEEVGELTTDH